MDTKEREGFIFYNSFWKAIKELPKENQLDIYNAIAEYSFTLEEPELLGLSKTIWILIKPQLEANNRRYLNGIKPKSKQEESKQEANDKQEESKSQGKEKEKEKEKENIYMDLENFLSKWNEIFGKNYELTEDLKKAYKTCRNKYSLEQVQIASSNYYKDKVSKRTKEERKKYELHIIKFLSQKNGLPAYL